MIRLKLILMLIYLPVEFLWMILIIIAALVTLIKTHKEVEDFGKMEQEELLRMQEMILEVAMEMGVGEDLEIMVEEEMMEEEVEMVVEEAVID